ncbi:MAG: Nif3-like dinuclear metal center hexameric protein, partial [Oscillospiraceae bacterium]|nr:Nif3-like dinuclear metal center hexameric protein [Oscillospiraceae bacterium]
MDFYKFIDSIAPFETQESWDNSGFLVGNGEKEAKKVLLALDVTEPVLSEAAEIGAELIISHHPVIFGALKEFHPKNIAFLAAEKGIAIISAH